MWNSIIRYILNRREMLEIKGLLQFDFQIEAQNYDTRTNSSVAIKTLEICFKKLRGSSSLKQKRREAKGYTMFWRKGRSSFSICAQTTIWLRIKSHLWVELVFSILNVITRPFSKGIQKPHILFDKTAIQHRKFIPYHMSNNKLAILIHQPIWSKYRVKLAN